MQQRSKTRVLACAGLMLSLALAGCGNLSKVNDQGQAASPVWPDIALAMRPQGSYPDLDHLAMVKAGMNKDQLYDLLGRPHFQEGFFMVREWDYLFHVQTPAGDELCQYKVLFDRDRTARSFYWRTTSCEVAVKKGMLASVKEGT